MNSSKATMSSIWSWFFPCVSADIIKLLKHRTGNRLTTFHQSTNPSTLFSELESRQQRRPWREKTRAQTPNAQLCRRVLKADFTQAEDQHLNDTLDLHFNVLRKQKLTVLHLLKGSASYWEWREVQCIFQTTGVRTLKSM